MKEAKGPGTIMELMDAIPGRGGVHGVPAEGALAGRLRVSTLRRARERDDPDATIGAMSVVSLPGLAHRGDGTPPYAQAAAVVVLGDLLRGPPQGGHLRPPAPEGSRSGQLQDRLGVAPQGAFGVARAAGVPSHRARRGRRDLRGRAQRARRARATARRQEPCGGGGRESRRTGRRAADGDAAGGLAGRARTVRPRRDRPGPRHGAYGRLVGLRRSASARSEASGLRAGGAGACRQDPALVAHPVFQLQRLAARYLPWRESEALASLPPGVRLPHQSPLARARSLLLRP